MEDTIRILNIKEVNNQVAYNFGLYYRELLIEGNENGANSLQELETALFDGRYSEGHIVTKDDEQPYYSEIDRRTLIKFDDDFNPGPIIQVHINVTHMDMILDMKIKNNYLYVERIVKALTNEQTNRGLSFNDCLE